MLLLALILLPVAGAALAYLLPPGARRVLLVAAALIHLALVALLWRAPGATALAGWVADDPLGRIVLTLVSVLFAAVAHYAAGDLRVRDPRGGRAFVSCLLVFLAAMTLVALSHHFALLWIGMETTTLAVAPLIFHRDDRRSLEAVWKYLVLSSVAIAFALLGVFLLATAQPSGAAGGRPLVLDDMLAHARALDPVWLRAAFVFTLIGFGTKMGLAPLHTWKADTYGEAPSLVSGLMAGALTTCAFLALARVVSVCVAAGPAVAEFVQPPLVAFGLLSVAVGAAFMIGQRDVKRLLAYSSVEQMGMLALALGLGGAGAYGAVLHAVNNGVVKTMLFLVAGNVVVAAGAPADGRAPDIWRRAPVSAALLVVGLFAVTGSPPFGMFVSELTIITAAIAQHRPWVAGLTIALLAVVFVAMGTTILELVSGDAWGDAEPAATRPPERRWTIVAPLALAVVVLALGLVIPRPFAAALSSAAAMLGGHAP